VKGKEDESVLLSPIQLSVGDEPQEPFKLVIPRETLTALYGVIITTAIGWSLPKIGSWVGNIYRRKYFLNYLYKLDYIINEKELLEQIKDLDKIKK
jgi:hypothetical protein